MLVYYFLPFIVNNRYLRFQDSKRHNVMNVKFEWGNQILFYAAGRRLTRHHASASSWLAQLAKNSLSRAFPRV
jgi:hypothetical protein